MEREGLQRYVAGLEQIMRNSHLDMREVMDQFQELCHRIGPENNVTMRLIMSVRKTYKEIQDQLAKWPAVDFQI
jgi:Zn-dependent M16 (insulinase) family peptidase